MGHLYSSSSIDDGLQPLFVLIGHRVDNLKLQVSLDRAVGGDASRVDGGEISRIQNPVAVDVDPGEDRLLPRRGSLDEGGCGFAVRFRCYRSENGAVFGGDTDQRIG